MVGRRRPSGIGNTRPFRSAVKQLGEGLGCTLGGGHLGLGLENGVTPRCSVDGQYSPRTGAILAAQLDVQACPVVLDAKAVRFVAVFVQDAAMLGVGYEGRPSASTHLLR